MTGDTRRNNQPQAKAEVLVRADPETAFRLFTEEVGEWWVPGPINFFNAERSPWMEIEPWLGGRVLERYAPDDALVVAEITVFEPGTQLQLRGVVDDSMTDVHFVAEPEGTRVRVHAYLRAGGVKAFLFWPNVIRWFAAYVGRASGDGVIPGFGHRRIDTKE